MEQVVAEGKTKQIVDLGNGIARILSKDDITAGDGAKHDLLKGKAALATKTTNNVFALLKACGLPVAFEKQDGPISFVAPLCEMLKWEVVARREAHGSYLKRFPKIEKGTRFEEIQIEFFLKTSGRMWGKYELQCDDPLAQIRYGDVCLYKPSIPFINGTYFLCLKNEEIYERSTDVNLLAQMSVLAKHTFLILEMAWSKLGVKLVDFKIEFGIGPDGILYIADVIDNDSWRLVRDASYLDKQGYRDGDDLDSVLKNYTLVANETERFKTHQNAIVLWAQQNLVRIM